MKKKVFATLLAVSMIASMVPAAVSVQAADGDSIRPVSYTHLTLPTICSV